MTIPQPKHLRRSLLLAGLWHAAGVRARPVPPLNFPRDFGAHPDWRTEWWYVTGHATAMGRLFGFQLTFFRSRVDATQGMASRLAARQLIFAHAAVTDVQTRKLWHDQRITRASGDTQLDQAHASERDTDIALRDWTLRREANIYNAQIRANDFQLALQFTPRQPLLLQGEQGLSRKGPEATQASYYYSEPQLAVRGAITLQGQRHVLDTDPASAAWLDHEWSEALLHPQAQGWDWIGINLFDGSALTAFRLRDKAGNTLWDGGSFRPGTNGGREHARIFQRGEVRFTPQRRWTSPMSQASYPVEWTVQTPAGLFTVKAIIDPQELDSRASTGAIYWEGLSDLFDDQGRHAGRGYLEMTGYAGALRM
jgi:predicted secreted hydrolase